jgi:hypothetical protein
MLASPASTSLLVRTCWMQSVRVQRVLARRPLTSIDLAVGRLAFDSPGVERGSSGDKHDYAQVTWGRVSAGVVPACSVRWVHWKGER